MHLNILKPVTFPSFAFFCGPIRRWQCMNCMFEYGKRKNTSTLLSVLILLNWRVADGMNTLETNRGGILRKVEKFAALRGGLKDIRKHVTPPWVCCRLHSWPNSWELNGKVVEYFTQKFEIMSLTTLTVSSDEWVHAATSHTASGGNALRILDPGFAFRTLTPPSTGETALGTLLPVELGTDNSGE
jgi:hypothetical protein